MIKVSDEFKELMEERTDFKERAKITFTDGATMELTEADFTITNNTVTDGAAASAVPLGAAVERCVQLELYNGDDRFADYDFIGARIAVTLAFALSASTETIAYGTFTVVEPETYGETVIITAVDDMYLADKDFSTSLSFPVSLQTLLVDCCTSCGINLGTAGTFRNSTFEVQSAPDNSYTYRQIIGFIAMIAGGNARIDRNGSLQIMEYDFTSTTADHTLKNWVNLKVDTDDIIITGVECKYTSDNESVTALCGSEGYVLSITNPLISGQEQAAVDLIGAVMVGATFRQFEGDHIAYPIAEMGDTCTVYDRKGNSYFSFITDVGFTFCGYTTLKNSAESAVRNSSKYYSGAVEAIIAAKQSVKQERTAREAAVQKLSDALSAASGMYTTKTDTATYIHNKPNLSDSENVIKITTEAIGFSTDGGATYPFGVTVDGTTIMNIISTNGLDADWIKTGSILVEGKDASGNTYTVMRVDAETGNLYATKGTIGGWKLTDTRLASSDTIYIGAKEAGLMLINESDRPFIHVQDASSNTLFKIEREGKMYAADAEIHDSSVEYAMTNYKAMMRQTGTSPTELCIVVSKDDFETKTYLQLVDKDGNRYWINTGDNAKLASLVTTGVVTVGGALTASGDLSVSGELTASGGLTASNNPSLSWDIVKGSTTATLRRSGSSANGYGLAIAVGSTVNDLIDNTGKRTWLKGGDAISAASLTVSGSSTFSTNPLIKTLHGGTSYPALASATSTTAQVSYIASHVNSSSVAYLGVYGKWDGSSWASKNIVSSASDIRLKENVEDSEVDALSVINAIKMRQFDWKGNGYHQKVGFIADELEEVDPRLAFGGGYTEDGGMDTKTVDTFYLLAYTVKAVQEMSDKLGRAEARIDALENKLEQALAVIAKLTETEA